MDKRHESVLKYARKQGIVTSKDWTDFVSSVSIIDYKVGSPAEVFKMISSFAYKKVEYFLAVTLDGAHQPIRVHVTSKGLVNRTVVHPREVFRCAIEDMAVAVIVAHNHPSGSLEPSPDDIEITQRLVSAGEIVGIDVLDHLVIGKTGYSSLKERGRYSSLFS